MSENAGSDRPVVPRRVVQVLPFIIFALVALTAGLLATRTIESPYATPFFHLFFSDTKHMKVWLSTAALLLVLSQPAADGLTHLWTAALPPSRRLL